MFCNVKNMRLGSYSENFRCKSSVNPRDREQKGFSHLGIAEMIKKSVPLAQWLRGGFRLFLLYTEMQRHRGFYKSTTRRNTSF